MASVEYYEIEKNENIVYGLVDFWTDLMDPR